MSRPPTSRPTAYITREGHRALEEELRVLWKVTRPEVTRKVAEAAALGDRSENAEYIYGKKQLAEIDRRVRYLRKRLETIRVVDQLPADTSKVFFGAWFELTSDNGKREYRLVGPDEIDEARDYVSVDDVVRANLLALNGNISETAVNIGTGVPTTTMQLARSIEKVLGVKADLKPGPKRAGDVERSLLEPWSGLGKTVSLEEGISRTASWFRSRPKH